MQADNQVVTTVNIPVKVIARADDCKSADL
jgi:hypothetical protein